MAYFVRSLMAATALAALLVPIAVTPSFAQEAATVGAGRHEETSTGVALTGKWSKLTNAQDSGGSSYYASGQASFSLRFTGTSVSWLARTSPSSGISSVSLDGAVVGTVDRYSPSDKFNQIVWSRDGLGAGSHVITVTSTGRKNAAASGTSSHLDAMVVKDESIAVGPGVYQQDDPNLTLTGAWTRSANAADSGGTSSSASATATATLTFRGTDISWIGRKSSAGGIGAVVLDGIRQPDVDRYSPTNDYQQELFRFRDLRDGVHTITIEWTNKTNAQSRGTHLHLDAFVVRGARSPVSAGMFEEDSPDVSLTGPWTATTSSLDSGEKSIYANSRSSATLTFKGTSIAYIGRLSKSSGIAEITIDGKVAGKVDRYSAAPAYRNVLFSKKDLSAGVHTISVTWSGQKNTEASSDALHFDAFRVENAASAFVAAPGVIGDDSSAIAYEGPWVTSPSSGEQGGQSRYAMSASNATLSFSGTGIAWVGRKSAGSGIAKVTIDGIAQPDVDRYAATTSYQQTLFLKQGLTSGTHTIEIQWTGKKNSAASSASIHLDAFVVSDLSATKPSSVAIASADSTAPALGAAITWSKPATKSRDAITYRLTRSEAGGAATNIDLPDKTSYVDAGLAENTAFAYRLIARDRWGFSSQSSSTVNRTTGSLGVNKALGSSRCANPTATVRDGAALQVALTQAKAGDTIKLQPGTYRGRERAPGLYAGFTISDRHGTAAAPISICGVSGSNIRLSGSDVDYSKLNAGFLIEDSSWIRIENIDIALVHAGVEAHSSTNLVMDYLRVAQTSQAGIYLSKNSSDNVVAHSTISQTGKRDARFGEGIYVGSSLGNDTCEPSCAADRSSRNVIAYNTITGTTGEAIEAKEQTVGGMIYKNTVGATSGQNDITGSSLQIKGSKYVVYGNSLTSSLEQGIRILSGPYSDGATWGEGNVITKNTITFSKATTNSLAIYGFAANGTVIKCSNTVSPSSVKTAPAACMK
ncbi:parallel beta helix pectate lyase-like protein [Frigoribacterium sp. PhB160]|nr:parallel beta helix pectate lyase-like protein [Frigoribacterium sp. PhB160]